MSYPTNKKLIAEVQVRTIFEEGYGEIDHQLRYSHNSIPEILGQNLMLLNRIAGSSDEMASLINMMSKSFKQVEVEFENKIRDKDKKIINLRKKVLCNINMDNAEKESFIRDIDEILKKE